MRPCYCLFCQKNKKQTHQFSKSMSVFLYVCPPIDDELHHTIVKVAVEP